MQRVKCISNTFEIENLSFLTEEEEARTYIKVLW